MAASGVAEVPQIAENGQRERTPAPCRLFFCVTPFRPLVLECNTYNAHLTGGGHIRSGKPSVCVLRAVFIPFHAE